MIERDIAIGCIVSTEFLREIQEEWNPEYLESRTAQTVCKWCWTFYARHKKAPYKKIEQIFTRKSKGKLDESLAEEIETEILQSLSTEFSKKDFDVEVLLTDTREYFKERNVVVHVENVQALIDKGKIDEAIKLNSQFIDVSLDEETGIYITDKEQMDEAVRTAHKEKEDPLVKYSGALGELLNNELVRGRFVSILAPEKRGKTFILLDMALRALKQGNEVAFFQAGDMTQNDQLIRMGSYVTGLPNKEEHLGTHYVPVMDCIYNQVNDCRRKIRENHVGLVDGRFEDIVENPPTKEQLIELHKLSPEYKRCFNCSEFKHNRWGTPYVKKVKYKRLLTPKRQIAANEKQLYNSRQKFRLETYANGALTPDIMINQLQVWKLEGFEPKVILIDYMDLLVNDTKDHRQATNKVWKQVRFISQTFNALTVAPTQGDAKAYDKKTLTLQNFSEDKRKNAHVTAIIGLNQDPKGREKGLGLMRFNKILSRDNDFNPLLTVSVLQNLKVSKPVLESFHTPIPPPKEEKEEESSE